MGFEGGNIGQACGEDFVEKLVWQLANGACLGRSVRPSGSGVFFCDEVCFHEFPLSFPS